MNTTFKEAEDAIKMAIFYYEFDRLLRFGIQVDHNRIALSILEQTKAAQGDFLRTMDGMGNMGRIESEGITQLSKEQQDAVLGKYPRCTVCGKHIFIQAFKNEGVCSENCRKQRVNEPEQPGYHEIEMIRVPICRRCGKHVELAPDGTWRHS